MIILTSFWSLFLLCYTNNLLLFLCSLNMKQRQRELIRITVDNQAILKRIQSREPTYNHRQWLSQWHANRSYVANVSKYSHLWNQDNVPPMWLTHKLKQSAPKTSI